MKVVQQCICLAIKRENEVKTPWLLLKYNIREMGSKVVRHIRLLEVLKDCKPKLRRSIIENSGSSLIDALAEICYNYLKGNVSCSKAQYKELCKHKSCMREIVNVHRKKSKKISKFEGKSQKNIKAVQRRILLQKGGAFWTLFLTPIVAELSSHLVSKALQ